jgi:hypothetical protein
MVLYPWQQQVMDDADPAAPRTLNLVCDGRPDGVGKTQLCTWAWCHRRAGEIPPIFTSKAIRWNNELEPHLNIVLVDVPRALGVKKGFIQALREIRDGTATTPPRSVWMMVQLMPDIDKIAAADFRLWRIQERTLVQMTAAEAREFRSQDLLNNHQY